jgi:hypothetical protein
VYHCAGLINQSADGIRGIADHIGGAATALAGQCPRESVDVLQ